MTMPMWWLYPTVVIVIAVVIGIIFVVVNARYTDKLDLLVTPPPTLLESTGIVGKNESFTFTEPITLDDIRISVVRIGNDVTVLLDWHNTKSAIPFHLWVSVDNGNLVLHSPNNEPRTVEILPSQTLSLFGSVIYHELEDNRLVIDMQVIEKGDTSNE